MVTKQRGDQRESVQTKNIIYLNGQKRIQEQHESSDARVKKNR